MVSSRDSVYGTKRQLGNRCLQAFQRNRKTFRKQRSTTQKEFLTVKISQRIFKPVLLQTTHKNITG